ncbi:unnamed protein product [Moneuplotes crassus]|uniref:Uncharacterized protein n=1 Tax=Euplotes crassus TaxID=5936 RepID=A0AAD1UKA8_EUPCR|nr:unnamed protein product [Moneuplotes crassus]
MAYLHTLRRYFLWLNQIVWQCLGCSRIFCNFQRTERIQLPALNEIAMNIEIMEALKLDYCFCDNETVNNLISANCTYGLQVSSSKDSSRVPYYNELDETITACQAVEPMTAPSW